MSNPCKDFQYAVKFVAGLARPVDQLQQTVVAPGQYFTAINIFNPSRCKAVTFRWRVVVANGFDVAIGPTIAGRDLTLRPGQGLEIDTHHILGPNQAALRKGFVILESPCELDVVAVYSASPPPPPGQVIGPLVAFHTERVTARLIEACEDLTLDLSTGIRAWTITQATTLGGAPLPNLTVPRPAAVMANAVRLPGWAIQAGASWIGVQTFANVPNLSVPGFIPGLHTFRTCFTLCAGAGAAALDLWTLHDDSAVARLNGAALFSLPTSYGGPPVYHQITSGFLPGVNCLEIVVRNDQNAVNPNPIGLNARAILKVARGACPGGGCGCDCDDEPPVRLPPGAPAEAQPAPAPDLGRTPEAEPRDG